MLCDFPATGRLVFSLSGLINEVAANDGFCYTMEAVEELGNVENTIYSIMGCSELDSA